MCGGKLERACYFVSPAVTMSADAHAEKWRLMSFAVVHVREIRREWRLRTRAATPWRGPTDNTMRCVPEKCIDYTGLTEGDEKSARVCGRFSLLYVFIGLFIPMDYSASL
jgi:hypothetical protein